MERKTFYLLKIQKLDSDIEKVRDAKKKVERLHNDIFSTFLVASINNLELLISELMAEKNHVKALLEEREME